MSFRFYHKWLVTLSHVKPCNYIVYFSYFPFSKHILISLTPCRQIYLAALTMQTTEECIPYVLKGWNTSGHNITSRITQTFFWETCNGIVLKRFNKFKLRAWYEESVSANFVDNICQSAKVSGAVVGGLLMISQLRKISSPCWKHLLALPHLRH